ncbi:hypothetical protein [Rhizobium leucaenae]|uniref:Uncharacterized protein n=1 Tax=Rhizobium leucaenae TaxID=29450 RepID=A0A7W6ZU90_9HYPH|nr:hypothetical protein [Rhizobium leucaenae]MBB4568853.1 hypothetical protein [Rhizobium leucaenae]MBB6302070.1 hypothetical protein [Rhizobium leucaenae]
MKPNSNAGQSNPGRNLNGSTVLDRFLGRQKRVYLSAISLCCNVIFCTIGASPRQFIVFNILVLLAFAARTLKAMPVETENPSVAIGNRPPSARDWRPILSFSVQLLAACYAMTVLVDNLAASPTLLGSIHQ